jgi:hypothetical protein
MTQPRLLAPSLFAALALAAIAAGCSGGTSSSLPTAPGVPSAEAARHKTRVGAVLRIHIPPKPKHRKRGGRYVSPNMLSLTVAVQQVTASPWPSMPLQTLVVNTPQPCQTSGDGLTCTFAVKAYAGNNIFTFNEYATKNPTPQDTPLGTLTSAVTNVVSGGSSLDFVLEGVVNRVALAVPNPESTLDPASKNTEPIPIGTAASFPLTITPEDASGASIATDTFSSPITIQVPTANAGVTLALNKKCSGDTASATKVTLNCASDLNQVSIAYDGTVTQTGANAYVDSATVVASPQLASPSPQPAIVALTSNLLAYQLVSAPGGSPNISGSNVALDPVSGKMLFAYTVNSGNPTFVEFDPTNPSAAPATHGLGFAAQFLVFDSAGNIWTNDVTSPAIHCFTSISDSGATIGVSSIRGGITLPLIAPDGSGNIWYSGNDTGGYPDIGFIPDTCAAGSNTAKLPTGNADETVVGLALAQPSGGNAAIGMVTTDGPFNFYTANTATTATPTPAAAWPSGEFPEGLVNDKSFNIYGASYGTPVVNTIAAGTANIQTLVNLPPDSHALGLDQYSGTQSTAQALAVADQAFAGVALVNPAASTTEPLEIVANQSYGCLGVAYDKTGGAWEICYNGDGSIWAYHPIVTSTWAALPDAFQYTNPYQTVITVAETSGTDSSPFTVIANSNPGTIAIGTPWPGTPAFPHAIPVAISGVGSSVITIADKHGRKQSISVVVSPSGISTARHRRTHKPHR